MNKRILVASLISLATALLLLSPSGALAQLDPDFVNNACQGISGGDCSGGEDQVSSVRDSAINILSFVVGLAAVIMLIVGGLRFITANGDPQQIAAARMTVIYSIVGIVVALAAQAIVQFVFSEV